MKSDKEPEAIRCKKRHYCPQDKLPFQHVNFILCPSFSQHGGFLYVLSAITPELLFQTKRARFLYSRNQFLIEHGEGGVRREVQTIKASVSPG